MVSIPAILQRPEFRFTPVMPRTKRAFELDWSDKNNHKYDDIKLLRYLRQNYNYGVLGGYGNLIILDFDNLTYFEQIQSKLPETLMVKTSRGYHAYYYNPKIESSTVKDENNNPLIEIRAKGRMVVGPNSIHETGIIYKICKDHDISNITIEDLKSLLPQPTLIQKKPPQMVSSRNNCSQLMKNEMQPNYFSKEDNFNKKLCKERPIEIEILSIHPSLSPKHYYRKIITFLWNGKFYWTEINGEAIYFLKENFGYNSYFWIHKKVLMEAVPNTVKGAQENTYQLRFETITENENNKRENYPFCDDSFWKKEDGKDK